jgi:hypothetical protein
MRLRKTVFDATGNVPLAVGRAMDAVRAAPRERALAVEEARRRLSAHSPRVLRLHGGHGFSVALAVPQAETDAWKSKTCPVPRTDTSAALVGGVRALLIARNGEVLKVHVRGVTLEGREAEAVMARRLLGALDGARPGYSSTVMQWKNGNAPDVSLERSSMKSPSEDQRPPAFMEGRLRAAANAFAASMGGRPLRIALPMPCTLDVSKREDDTKFLVAWRGYSKRFGGRDLGVVVKGPVGLPAGTLIPVAVRLDGQSMGSLLIDWIGELERDAMRTATEKA